MSNVYSLEFELRWEVRVEQLQCLIAVPDPDQATFTDMTPVNLGERLTSAAQHPKRGQRQLSIGF